MPSIDDVLGTLGLDAAERAQLAPLWSAPPRSLLADDDLSPDAPPERHVLAVALIAASQHRLAKMLSVALEWLGPRLDALTAFDRARFWHLTGVAALRERAYLGATVALNRAVTLLGDERGAGYLPRVHDSLGRLLQAQGLVEDARREFRTAIALREKLGDEDGLALTLGNLARLELENGNWLAARDAFQRDHDIVLRRSPEQLRLRAQLLTHLGECERGLGNPRGALAYLERARLAAKEAADTFGIAIASIEQARAMTAIAQPDAAKVLEDAAALADSPDVAAPLRPGLVALLEVARAELAAKDERQLDAEAAFARALDAASRSTLLSPIEHALIARAAARFQIEVFGGGRAVEYLQRALRLLDATGAAQLRQDVEAELQRCSHDAWTLHVVSRFIGKTAIDLALREAGREGFRGERVEVAVLFADLRGFTSAAETLTPTELVGSLNQFLSRMAGCVELLGGLVDKFVGDAVMAVFGIAGDTASSVTASVRAALLMQAELERLNRASSHGGQGGKLGALQMGVGLHFGPAVVGLIGSPQHRSYTALGATVNLASRMEGMTKQLGARVLISGEVVAHLPPGAFLLRPLGRYAAKGAHGAIDCFEVMSEGNDLAAQAQFGREIELSRLAAAAALAGDAQACASALRDALALAKGSWREIGYQLRLESVGTEGGVIRMLEK